MESPERFDKLRRSLKPLAVRNGWTLIEPEAARLKFYEAAHDPMYIAGLLSELEAALDSYFIDSDTYISPGTQAALEALSWSAHHALEAAEKGELQAAFIAGRPPGHHAGVSGPGLGAPSLGACLLNTAASLALKASSRGLKVVLVDFDLNHGNGSQEIVEAFGRENLFLIDVHQDWRTTFPWTGEPGVAAGGHALNIVVPGNSGDDIILSIVDGVEALVDELEPDLVIVSAGFDFYKGDSHLTLTRTTSRFFHRIGLLVSKYPSISVLETGFSAGLERGAPAYLAGLSGSSDPIGDRETRSSENVWREFEELNKNIVEFV